MVKQLLNIPLKYIRAIIVFSFAFEDPINPLDYCFKYIVNLLLILVTFQVFNLNTAECTASANDGSITANHTLTYVAQKCWDHTFEHQHAACHSHDGHHKNRTWKKFYSSGFSLTTTAAVLPLLTCEEVLQHFAGTTGYRFQYFRPINPPPPKA